MIIYRGMDRQTLDAAYNNSAAVADSDQYLADWMRRSEALRGRMPDHLDLVYGDAPRTRPDFFAASRPAAATLLFFHDGYWQRNAKEGFSFIAEGPLAHGLHVAVAGYTLAREARMGHCPRGAHCALLAASASPGIGRQSGADLCRRLVGRWPSRRNADGPADGRGWSCDQRVFLIWSRFASAISTKSSASTQRKRGATARCTICRHALPNSSSLMAPASCRSSNPNHANSARPGARAAFRAK
jgi:hypothetical protein